MQTTPFEDKIPDIIFDLAISPGFLNDATCFSARRSGLYRSEDGGNNWRYLYSSLKTSEQFPTSSIALSPNFVEDVIRNGTRSSQDVNGVTRTLHSSGSLRVVTEQNGRIVVTIENIHH